jgi:hypothetical protein
MNSLSKRELNEPTVPTDLDTTAPVYVANTRKPAIDHEANARALAAFEAERAKNRRPMPARLKPVKPTLPAILSEIEAAAEALDNAESTFTAELQHDPKADLPKLRAIVRDLEEKLSVAADELRALEESPSPTEKFVEHILTGENQVEGIARSIVNVGADQDAHKLHG